MVTPGEAKKLPTILLVEDSEDDRFFFKRALSRVNHPHHLVSVVDGHEVLKYLEQAHHSSASDGQGMPDVIFLDLKLPKFSGFEVLQWLNKQALLGKTRVVVLSGSDEQKDRARAQELGASDYVVKPIQSDYLRTCLSEISQA